VGEDEIDLVENHGKLLGIEETIREATAKHNAFLKELGLPLLP
jgi:type I restriction enzyme M protein